MSIIIDLIAIGIIVLFAILSAKKGFVRSLIEVVGFILVMLFAVNVSPALADKTYDKFVEPSIIGSLENVNFENINTAAEIPALPKTVSALLGDNFNLSAFKEIISENISKGVTDAVTIASQQAVKPVVTDILSLLYTVIISVVLLFVVNILAKFINKIFSFSIIGKANRILGALLGVIKGIVIVSVFCTAISLLLSISPAGFWIFTPSAVAGSVIIKMLTFKM